VDMPAPVKAMAYLLHLRSSVARLIKSSTSLPQNHSHCDKMRPVRQIRHDNIQV